MKWFWQVFYVHSMISSSNIYQPISSSITFTYLLCTYRLKSHVGIKQDQLSSPDLPGWELTWDWGLIILYNIQVSYRNQVRFKVTWKVQKIFKNVLFICCLIWKIIFRIQIFLFFLVFEIFKKKRKFS